MRPEVNDGGASVLFTGLLIVNLRINANRAPIHKYTRRLRDQNAIFGIPERYLVGRLR